MLSIPPHLRSRPFSLTEATEAGLSAQALRGRRFRRLHRGVYALADLPLTHAMRIDAAALALPRAFLSHVTGLQHLGVDIGTHVPLHLSTRGGNRHRLPGIVLHRSERLPVSHGRCLSAEHCWLQSANLLELPALIAAGDALIHRRHTTLERLWTHVEENAGVHGVRSSRDAITFVRERVESPRETLLRLTLWAAGLPEPRCNIDIVERGRFLARGDLVYEQYRVLVEYDGRQHVTDHRQWERDVIRHEHLSSTGWIIIRVTSAQLRDPRAIAHRVYAALAARGYPGPRPSLPRNWSLKAAFS